MCVTSSEAEAGVPRVGVEVGSGDWLRLRGRQQPGRTPASMWGCEAAGPPGRRTAPPSSLLPGLPSPHGTEQTPLFMAGHEESSICSPQTVKCNKTNHGVFKARLQDRQGLLPCLGD